MADHAKTGVALSNNMYDKLKWVAQLGLPAVGVLYAALAVLWGLPHGFEVVGTVTALEVFLGAVLGLSKKSYEASDAPYDGAIVVDATDPENPAYRFQLDATDAETLLNKKQIVFKGVDAAQ